MKNRTFKQFRKRKKYIEHEIEPVKTIVNRALHHQGIDPNATDSRHWQDDLLKQWNNMVGDPIALHTRPMKIAGGRLTILVDSPAWNQELQTFGGRTLLQTIQKSFPGVKELRFRVGRWE